MQTYMRNILTRIPTVLLIYPITYRQTYMHVCIHTYGHKYIRAHVWVHTSTAWMLHTKYTIHEIAIPAVLFVPCAKLSGDRLILRYIYMSFMCTYSERDIDTDTHIYIYIYIYIHTICTCSLHVCACVHIHISFWSNILAYSMEKQKASKLGPAARRFLDIYIYIYISVCVRHHSHSIFCPEIQASFWRAAGSSTPGLSRARSREDQTCRGLGPCAWVSDFRAFGAQGVGLGVLGHKLCMGFGV